jgi:hypothetical protein
MLGLSGENVTRLAAGEPIRFNLSSVGWPPCEVLIVYGQTEERIVADVKRHFDAVRPTS